MIFATLPSEGASNSVVLNIFLTADNKLKVQDIPVIGMRKENYISEYVYFTVFLSAPLHRKTSPSLFSWLLATVVCTPCGTTNTQAIFYLSSHVMEHAMVYHSHRVTCGLSAAENGEESIVVQSGDLGGQTMDPLLPIHTPVIVWLT
jgi:hypothetical protein